MNTPPNHPYNPFTPPPAPEPAPQPEPPALEGPLDSRRFIDALLRSPGSLARRLAEDPQGLVKPSLLIILVSLLIYGVVLGCFAGGEQLWAAPLKILTGMLISGVICFPSLYIFCCLSGSRMTAGQIAMLSLSMLALCGLLLLGFAPAVWIFTQATNSFGFMGVLALGAWLAAFIFGCRYLFLAMKATGATHLGPVRLWSLIFLLVTLQMSTSLRPILGRSDDFLPGEKLFFLQHWGESMDKDLSSTRTPVRTSEP